jgi:hypothetical protein
MQWGARPRFVAFLVYLSPAYYTYYGRKHLERFFAATKAVGLT